MAHHVLDEEDDLDAHRLGVVLDVAAVFEDDSDPLSASHAGSDAGDGEHVPALEDVLQLVGGRLTVMCELKATPGDEKIDQRLVDAGG